MPAQHKRLGRTARMERIRRAGWGFENPVDADNQQAEKV